MCLIFVLVIDDSPIEDDIPITDWIIIELKRRGFWNHPRI